MQIRCSNCHKPFAMNKDMVHAALAAVDEGSLSHYDAVCPHCRRVNHVSRAELLRAAPDWKPANKEQAKQE